MQDHPVSFFDMFNCVTKFSYQELHKVIFFHFIMQTIAVVPIVPHGVVQLGSLDIVS